MNPHARRLGRWVGALTLALIPLVAQAAPAGAVGTTALRLLTTGSPDTRFGLQIFANANLLGAGSTPTGTITFRAFGPGDTTCSSPIFTSTVAVAGTSVNSPRFTPAHAGTYIWQSTYSGDATYSAEGPTSCADPAADVIVSKAATFLTAAAAPPAPPAIHGTATLGDGVAPTGTITFLLTGPDDTFCSTPPVFSATVAVHGNGTYDSGPFAPTRSGNYTWRAAYGGDADNLATSFTACLAAGASQTVTVPSSTAVQRVPYSVWTQPTATPLDGIGSWLSPANDPTASAGQLPPQYLYGHSFRFAGSAASGVVGLATGSAGKLALLSVTGPDGVSHSTGIAFNWSANGFYFPFVYGAAPGVWGASIYDFAAATWTPIGSLGVPAGWGKLSPVTTTMAIWYGPTAGSCAAYPRANVAFSPPVGYIGQTASLASVTTTATMAGDCTSATSVESSGWARYLLGT